MDAFERLLSPRVRSSLLSRRAALVALVQIDFETKLAHLRSDAHSHGGENTGPHIVSEWAHLQGFIQRLGFAYLDAALEICEEYQIRLDNTTISAIRISCRDVMAKQYKRIHLGGQTPGNIRVPLTVHLLPQYAQGHRLPYFDNLKKALKRAAYSAPKSPPTRTQSTRLPRKQTKRSKGQHAGRPYVIRVLIACPSDVEAEKRAVIDVINDWNAGGFNSLKVILQAIEWKQYSHPASGAHPQKLINNQIVTKGDFLIGIFGMMLGTPTASSISGTAEEIEIFRKAKRHVALYFSTADLPRNYDRAQFDALNRYKQDRKSDTLYGEYQDIPSLKEQIHRHLSQIVPEVCKTLRIPFA